MSAVAVWLTCRNRVRSSATFLSRCVSSLRSAAGAISVLSATCPPILPRASCKRSPLLGLDGLALRAVSDLSVGQFQRALFARMLMHDADVLLLDEPFTTIDERTSEDPLHLLRDWHEEGRTIAAVLHDLAEVRAHSPRTLLK
jgi:ABC-type molybdenum transport system ATPase subunit/photorepair protein PhrA